jgi:hypothetical protein
VTDTEADDTVRRQDSAIVGQILSLESSQARTVREWILGDASAIARLKGINDQIVALRPQLSAAKRNTL